MKICPECSGFVLYEDEHTNCPRCNRILDSYQSSANQRIENINTMKKDKTVSSSNDNKQSIETNIVNTISGFKTEERNFETISGRNYRIEGVISEITAITRYQTRFHKIVNSIFRAEPYQLGHSTHSVRIRVEENTLGLYPENVRDIIAMGDYEGKLFIGSDVTINAIERSERLITRTIYMHDTQKLVYPGFQIPSIFIRLLATFLIFIIFNFILSILDGSLFSMLGILFMTMFQIVINMISPIIPYIVIFGGAWYYFKKWRS